MITKFGSLYAGHVDLDNIGFDGTPVNDLTPLHDIPELERVTIERTTVSYEQIRALKRAIPGIEFAD